MKRFAVVTFSTKFEDPKKTHFATFACVKCGTHKRHNPNLVTDRDM